MGGGGSYPLSHPLDPGMDHDMQKLVPDRKVYR